MADPSTRPENSPTSPASRSSASEPPDSPGQAGSAPPAASPYGPTARRPSIVRVVVPRSQRCSERACIFPAALNAMGKCLYHHLEAVEPNLFESIQPTLSMLDQAKFGLPDSEPDDSRVVDRNRQAAQRVAFLLEEAA